MNLIPKFVFGFILRFSVALNRHLNFFLPIILIRYGDNSQYKLGLSMSVTHVQAIQTNCPDSAVGRALSHSGRQSWLRLFSIPKNEFDYTLHPRLFEQVELKFLLGHSDMQKIRIIEKEHFTY